MHQPFPSDPTPQAPSFRPHVPLFWAYTITLLAIMVLGVLLSHTRLHDAGINIYLVTVGIHFLVCLFFLAYSLGALCIAIVRGSFSLLTRFRHASSSRPC